MNTRRLPHRNVSPTRSTNIDKKKHYRQYKPYLKEDFQHRCGYCGIHDMYFASGKGFHIDHFAPKSKFSHLELEYTNLVYSCSVCNIAKSDDWVGQTAQESIKDGIGYMDPCNPEFDTLFSRSLHGKIIAKHDSSIANYMFEKLNFALKRHELFWLNDYFSDITSELAIQIVTLQDNDPQNPIIEKLKDLLVRNTLEANKYKNMVRAL